ncbi:hypothetical protein [Nonomuraea solani]|nr:hypothetical protein [Nonomuraea solani]
MPFTARRLRGPSAAMPLTRGRCPQGLDGLLHRGSTWNAVRRPVIVKMRSGLTLVTPRLMRNL